MAEITVIITAYKLEKQLPGILDQLLHQTFQDFEIVALDDASPDGTARVIAEYAKKYPQKIFPLLLDTNLGNPGKTRNAALDSGLVSGRYTIFLDGDDPIEPDFLEKMHSACETEQAEAAVCAYDRVEEESGHVLCHELKWLNGVIPLPPQDDRVAFLNGALWNKLFRTECIGKMRSTSLKGGQDVEFGLRILQRCGQIACVPEELIHYQVRGGSVSKNTTEDAAQAFAMALAAQHQAAENGWKDTLALVSFLHTGLSMALRMDENPSVDSVRYLRWCRKHMKEEYGFYRGVSSLRLRSLSKRGAKGVVIWASLQMHRLNCFRLALIANRLIRRVLHIDIKF